MTDILNHAITVRDALYVIGATVVLACVLIGWLVWLTHPLTEERKRMKQARRALANEPNEHLRNPAYGMPKPGIKWQDGKPYVAKENNTAH